MKGPHRWRMTIHFCGTSANSGRKSNAWTMASFTEILTGKKQACGAPETAANTTCVSVRLSFIFLVLLILQSVTGGLLYFLIIIDFILLNFVLEYFDNYFLNAFFRQRSLRIQMLDGSAIRHSPPDLRLQSQSRQLRYQFGWEPISEPL